MKKLLFILVLSLLVVSCNKYIVSNVYEKTYTTQDSAVTDTYNWLNFYEVDSIPLEQWPNNLIKTDTTTIDQKMIRKVHDKNTNYQFILTSFMYPHYSYYTFLIRYRGKK